MEDTNSGDVSSRVERLIAETRDGWIGSIDRSVIGYLAVPFESLVLHAAIITMNDRDEPDYIAMSTSLERAFAKSFGGALGRDAALQMSHVSLEYCHWWAIEFGEPHYSAFSMPMSQSDMMRVWVLERATERPERLPYLEAGLVNTVFIDNCIADDVDASLALSMWDGRQ